MSFQFSTVKSSPSSLLILPIPSYNYIYSLTSNPGQSPQINIFTLITSAKILLPYRVTYSQVLGTGHGDLWKSFFSPQQMVQESEKAETDLLIFTLAIVNIIPSSLLVYAFPIEEKT